MSNVLQVEVAEVDCEGRDCSKVGKFRVFGRNYEENKYIPKRGGYVNQNNFIERYQKTFCVKCYHLFEKCFMSDHVFNWKHLEIWGGGFAGVVHRARGWHRGMPQISFHFQVCISTDVQTPVFINIRVRRYIVRRCVYNVHCTSSFHFDFELLREFSDGTTGLGWKGSICTKRFKSRSKLNSLKKNYRSPISQILYSSQANGAQKLWPCHIFQQQQNPKCCRGG